VSLAPVPSISPTTIPTPVYASPADTAAHGVYAVRRNPGDPRPWLRFGGRLGSDTSPAVPGRYHLYAGWFCPWAHRTTLVRELAGLTGLVGVSYVHGERDARGWAFREPTGPDPVEGFTLLREAYEATEPGFDGHVSVPTLWDRVARRVVSNTYGTLDVDLATAFAGLPEVASDAVELYPPDLRRHIDALESWLHPTVNQGAAAGAAPGNAGSAALSALLEAFAQLDRRLGGPRYLLGDRLTLADVRLYVTLVRYDVGALARRPDAGRLARWPNLWRYTLDLHRIPAFAVTTDVRAFAVPGADLAPWT
jgi:putative glutathione S-transferase